MTATRRSSSLSFVSILFFATVAICAPANALAKTVTLAAKTATTITLQVAPTCLAQGCVTTLTATLIAGSTPVHPGSVFFCEATLTDCEYGVTLGEAQSLTDGTATIKRALGPGTHQIHAYFRGTSTYSPSVSATDAVTIVALNASNATQTTLTATPMSGYPYYGVRQAVFSSSVTAPGPAVPTGTVSFLDQTNGNAVVASETLSNCTANYVYTAGGLDISQIPASLLNSVTAASTGDFNNDGFLDVVVSNASGIRVLLGSSTGKFSLAPSTTNVVGSKAVQVLVGDFNSDGKLDIAVPEVAGKLIHISLGNGDGTFTDTAPITLPSNLAIPSSVVAAIFLSDFNADGIPDLAANLQQNSAVQPILGKGDGTFTVTASTYGGPAIGVADYDVDGIQDIATIQESAIGILHSNGDGTFSDGPYSRAYGFFGVSGDFNNDGVPDIAASDQAYLQTYEGYASPFSGDFVTFPTDLYLQLSVYVGSETLGGGGVGLVTGDFNGDGVLDLGFSFTPQYGISPPSGFIGFTTHSVPYGTYSDGPVLTGLAIGPYIAYLPLPGNNVILAFGDFNSDGKPDAIGFDPSAGMNTPPTAPGLTFVGASSTTASAMSSALTIAGAGTHSIVASYSGDSTYQGGVSAPVYVNGVQTTSYASGFSNAAGLSLNNGVTIQNGALQLTDGGKFESRSAFTAERVPVYLYQSTFDFTLTPHGDGLAFVIQTNGPNAIGASGGGIGYGTAPGATTGPSIINSIALVFDTHNNQGEGDNSIRLEVGGLTSPAGSHTLEYDGIDLNSGHAFEAQITGDSGTLEVKLTDLTTTVSDTIQFTADIFEALGDSVGYVGFTSGTGVTESTVNILNWTYQGQGCCDQPDVLPSFANGFANATTQMQLNKGAAISGSSLVLANGTPFAATSAYFKTKVAPALFTTDFDFQIEGNEGDGFTFVLQDQGLNAVGADGGGLGYGSYIPGQTGYGIGKSIAIKFDLHNNDGEGIDSTGIYENGAFPGVPAVDLSSSRVHLNSGHAFHARIFADSSDKGNFVLSITDLTDYAVFNTALPLANNQLIDPIFAGFTAGTGKTANTIRIKNWTWNEYVVDQK